MTQIAHPSSFLKEEITQSIRSTSGEAEQMKQLHPDQLTSIYQEQLLKMYVPTEYGGLALSLPEILKKEEGLAWTDGSTAWVVTLCSGAGWFVGFLNQERSKELFSDHHVCICGSGATSGIAEQTKDGYTVNGSWKYASGSQHATAFTANCILQKDGVQLRHEDGSLVVRSFIFKKNEVQLTSDWKGMGMIATSSYSFEVKNLNVSEDRSFIIDANHTTRPEAIYRFPFLQLAETTLAVNISGMGLRFLELGYSILLQRAALGKTDRSAVALVAIQQIDDMRSRFYQVVTEAWDAMLKIGTIDPKLLLAVSKASHSLVTCTRRLVAEAYPYCGLEAANTQKEINRVWRNLNTAGQHSLFIENSPLNDETKS